MRRSDHQAGNDMIRDMVRDKIRAPRLAAGALACCLLLAGFAPAQARAPGTAASGWESGAAAAAADQAGGTGGSAGRRQETALKRVSDSVGVVHSMTAEACMGDLIGRARGVYIVPGPATRGCSATSPRSPSTTCASTQP
jgi:hypothetical protein